MARAKACQQWGFDSTDFGGTGPFKNVLDAIHAKYKAERIERDTYYMYVWTGPRVCLTTYYNPLTGEAPYKANYPAGPQIGYAGYMGLTGEAPAVGEAVLAIRANAVYVKDESPGRRDYI